MSTAYQPMDFSESKALARTSAESSGLTLLKEKKHVTLGWHMTGNGHAGLSHIFEATLGKYRDSLKGVPVAIGPIKPKGSVAYIIDDHSCMHLDVTATFVVFVPKIGATYQAEVTKVDPTTVTAKMYDIITARRTRS
uniref:Uncharacterized protein n=1 Tax=Plectus sambesii TaxID=2011161 RepID=A0A914VYS1_9BILA